MDLVFEKLANGITKHYKKILVAWIIILIAAVPAMLQVGNVVVYEETGMASGKYESLRAADIISEEFPITVANSTIIIVLQNQNMTDEHARNFVLELQERIYASSKIRYLEDIKSVYSIEELALIQGAVKIAPQTYALQGQVNMTAFMLYGIPALQLQTWVTQTNQTDPVPVRDAQAYAISYAMLQYILSPYDNATKLMANGYFSSYSQVWNSTSYDYNLTSNPRARADYSIGLAAPLFISSLQIPQEQKLFMTYVLASFNLDTFSNQQAIHAFTINTISTYTGISNTTFLEQVYLLGPSPDFIATATLARSIVENGTVYTYPIQLPSQYLTNFISPDNGTMLFMALFTKDDGYSEKDGTKPIYQNVNYIRDIINNIRGTQPQYNDITTYVTGGAAMSQDVETSSFQDLQLIEPFTIIIIIVLMGVLFRSVIAEFIPLGAVGVALGVSQALVFVIGSTVANIHYTALTMLFTVLMGVGTDYSIFIMTRYREERIKGADRERAVHTAVMWAGESIVTSGATVIISFFAMGIASFSMIQTMGLTLGMAIIVALLVALTLIPSLLLLLGNRIFWPTTGARWDKFAKGFMEKKNSPKRDYFYKAASFSVKHGKVVLLAAVLVTVPTAYIYATQTTSFDFIGMMPQTESVRGMQALTDDFGAGTISPTQVVLTDGPTVYYGNASFDTSYLWAVENMSKMISVNGIVQQVVGPTRPFGTPVDFGNISKMPEEQRQLILDGMLATIGKDNSTVLLKVTLKEQPQSADSVNFMPTLRSQVAQFKASTPILATTAILVGGTTATTYDISSNISAEFGNMEIIVVIGIFIVLMIVLGSVLLPAFAIISIAISITWSYAVTWLVFGVWLDKPILFMVPLILFIMLMGIGMDYNVFILTRIREEVHKGKDNNTAVVDAIDWTGGIITALALIMGGAFATMMLSSNAMLQEFGLCLTLAIILDAMVVRTYIVPAAMSLMGKHAWWAPGRLQREGRGGK
jgi:RND superfamily putative drug exporter